MTFRERVLALSPIGICSAPLSVLAIQSPLVGTWGRVSFDPQARMTAEEWWNQTAGAVGGTLELASPALAIGHILAGDALKHLAGHCNLEDALDYFSCRFLQTCGVTMSRETACVRLWYGCR